MKSAAGNAASRVFREEKANTSLFSLFSQEQRSLNFSDGQSNPNKCARVQGPALS